MQQVVRGNPVNEKKTETEDDKYTRKLNEMSELLDFVLSMKIEYYQNRYPGSSRDGIISLVNYEILESKYKEWDAVLPPELQNFFKNRARRVDAKVKILSI